MPRFYPDALFSDCWSSVGDVTFYHRNGVCYFRSKAYSEFAGTDEQLEQKSLHQRAIKAWRGLTSKQQNKWRKYADGVAAHRPPYGDGNSISGYNLFMSAYHGFAQLGDERVPVPRKFDRYSSPKWMAFVQLPDLTISSLEDMLRDTMDISVYYHPVQSEE